jgi:hypothetical protein
VAAIILAVALPVRADLRIIPSLTVSERYDSNVLFFNSGRSNADFVTTVSPAVSASYRGRPLTATLSGGVGISAYAKNSNFNYVSTLGSASVDLTQLVGRLDKRASLQIAETVQYTPELPALVSEPLGASPCESGLQPQRVRSFTSITSVSGKYTLTSRVNVLAAYTYNYLDFGNTIGAAPQTALFGTTFQSFNVGPNITLSPTDTLNLQYQYRRADYKGEVPGFHTQGGTVGLTHKFSRQLTASVSAGMTKITPSDRVTPLFNASASWSERNTTATISFSRSVTPSFLIAASALTSNVFAVSVSQGLTDSLSGAVSVNYARSTSVTGTSAGVSGITATGAGLSFDSIATSMSLSYKINRSLQTSFSYSHTDYKQEQFNLSSDFQRDVVMLSLTASWM